VHTGEATRPAGSAAVLGRARVLGGGRVADGGACRGRHGQLGADVVVGAARWLKT
jgi:hypothetical protein